MERRTRVSTATVFVGWLVALMLALPASGQNWIAAGSFDTPEDLAVWQNAETATWSPLDFTQSANSGSAQISNDLDSGGAFAIWAFVPANPGEVFTFRVRAWIPPGQVGTGRAQLRVLWWDASSAVGGFCPWAQTVVGSDEGEVTTAIGSWELLEATVVAPAGTTCAQMRLRNHKSDAALFVVHFDEAEVFLPEPMAAPLGAAAIATLGLLGRRRARRAAQDGGSGPAASFPSG